MGDPAKVPNPGEDWRYAALPNPFLSQNPESEPCAHAADVRSTSPQGGVSEFSQSQPLERNEAASVATVDLTEPSGLPQPFAILDSFDEGSAAVETEDQFQNSVLDPDSNAQVNYQRLRGIGLIGAVFNILSKELGGHFSTADLMLAAQQLIDISKVEYVGIVHKDASERPGYYSWDLVRAFAHQWEIARVETARMDHCDVDEYSPESYENAKLLLQGWNERKWEF